MTVTAEVHWFRGTAVRICTTILRSSFISPIILPGIRISWSLTMLVAVIVCWEMGRYGSSRNTWMVSHGPVCVHERAVKSRENSDVEDSSGNLLQWPKTNAVRVVDSDRVRRMQFRATAGV